MREVIIIIIILIAIISIGLLTEQHLKDTSEELNVKLEELKKGIDTSINDNIDNKQKLKELSEEIDNKWKILNKTWSIIVLHDELDLIKLSILEVKSCVEIGDLETGREEIEKTIFLVEHIKEKEALKLRNIF